MKEDKLSKSSKDRVLAGVCGGLGEYYNIDPVLFRLAFVVLSLCGGFGLLIYIILYFVIPEELSQNKSSLYNRNEIFAWIIILIGFLFLIDQFLRFNVWRFFLPLIFIGLGILFLKRGSSLYKR